MKKLMILLVLLGFSQPILAQFNKAGRTSMQFLKIGMGSRETAMGEACIANLNDINSVFWNPAGLTKIENREVSFNYTKWFADLSVMSSAIGIKLENWGVLALNWVFMDYGDLEEALVTSPTGGMDTRTGNIFTGKDIAIGIAFARQFTDKLSIGLNVRYIREDLYKFNSSLVSFDVGSYYETGWKGVRLAMSAQNFSGSARWMKTGEEAQHSYEIPLVFRIGFSIDLLGHEDLLLGGNSTQHQLSFNLDAMHSNDYAERLNMGLEYIFLDQFFIRGGYRMNYDDGNLSFGMGANTEFAGVGLKVDYSFVSYDFLDSPHRISLVMAF